MRNGSQGERVVDGRGHSGGRWRREQDEPAAGAAGSDPGGDGTVGVDRRGSGWLGSGRRSARTGRGLSRSGGHRRSGSWRDGASGSGRRFTGVKSGSGSSWPKDCREGARAASGCGGSWAAECERSAGRSGDARKCWRRFRAELEDRLRLGAGRRWEKSIPKRCGGSRARRENFTAVAWKGRRNGRGKAARSDGLSTVYNLPIDRYSRRLGVGRADGAGTGARRRAGLREDEAGRGEGQPTGGALAHVQSRSGPGRDGPKRSGPERDYGPSR